MNELLGFVAAAVIVEGIVSYASTIYSDGKVHWKMVGAIVVGVLVAFNMRLDFFTLLGLKEVNPVIGTALTGILISRGSNYVYDLYDSLTCRKADEKSPDVAAGD